MTTILPLVSCLMVTRCRPGYVERAVRSYRRQTWSRKELVIVHNSNPVPAWLLTLASESEQIVICAESPLSTLGALRNAACQRAAGDILVQWDDDDQYHSTRIATQVAALIATGARAVVLCEQLLFFEPARELYWIDRSRIGGIEGTLASHSSDMPKYPPMSKGEDSVLVDAYRTRRQLALMADGGLTYLRTYHGANTWSGSHFKRHRDFARTTVQVREHLTELEVHLREYDFGGNVEIRICGRDGLIGIYDPILGIVKTV